MTMNRDMLSHSVEEQLDAHDRDNHTRVETPWTDLSAEDAFNRWCDYEGIIGYGHQLAAVLDELREASSGYVLKEGEEQELLRLRNEVMVLKANIASREDRDEYHNCWDAVFRNPVAIEVSPHDERWGEELPEVVLRVEGFFERGDPSVGIPDQAAIVVADDQSGTLLGELLGGSTERAVSFAVSTLAKNLIRASIEALDGGEDEPPEHSKESVVLTARKIIACEVDSGNGLDEVVLQRLKVILEAKP